MKLLRFGKYRSILQKDVTSTTIKVICNFFPWEEILKWSTHILEIADLLSYGQSFQARYIYVNPSCSVSPSRHISFLNIVESRLEEDLDKDNQTESRKKEEDAQILKASAPDNFTFCPLF